MNEMTTAIKNGDKVMLNPAVKGGITEQDYSVVAKVTTTTIPFEDGTFGVYVDQPIAGFQWWNSEDLVVVDGDN